MINLIRNEWMKIFHRIGTYVMIGMLILIVTVMGAMIKYQESRVSIPPNENWVHGLQLENKTLTKQLEEMRGTVPESSIYYYEKQIALNEYRIEHHVSPYQEYSIWSFLNDASALIDLVGMFTIIIAAGMIASEFNWGTIKLLLIRPIKRGKILLAKYLTVLLFGVLLLMILFGFSALIGVVLLGFPEQASPYLNYYQGIITEQSMFMHPLINYGLYSINMFMLTTLAFMISTVFRNNSLAIGLSLILMLLGTQITQLIATKFTWAKYILFANTNLLQYFEGVPMVQGMTLSFSIITLVIYFLLFLMVAYFSFYKRDVSV